MVGPASKASACPPHRIDSPHTHWTRVGRPWYNPQNRRLDIATGTALWFPDGLPPVPIRYVLIRDGAGPFDPQAVLSTAASRVPAQRLAFGIPRWGMPPTFQHVRTPLGVETHRQWFANAIARLTPALLGLVSLVTWLAQALLAPHPLIPRPAAWYPNP